MAGKKKMTFEDAVARLEEIVNHLESGDMELEESLKLFQEGTELVASCGKLLDEAELTVKKIVPGPDGTPTEEAFAYEQ